MKEVTRNSGIDVIGSVNWGTHFCQFYNTKQDLVDIIIPYLKAGLESNEFCIWVASNPLANGYDGLRLFEGIFSLEEEYRDDFAEYEREINRVIGNSHMLVLCTYFLSKYNAAEIFSIIERHQFALIKREGKWEKIKSFA